MVCENVFENSISLSSVSIVDCSIQAALLASKIVGHIDIFKLISQLLVKVIEIFIDLGQILLERLESLHVYSVDAITNCCGISFKVFSILVASFWVKIIFDLASFLLSALGVEYS